MKAREYTTGGDVVPQAAPMDIAIVGMACRFPGAADYHEFWRNIVAKRNCIREVPPDRWDWRHHFGGFRPEPVRTGMRWGGFIDDVDKFDPLFFGISPNEAAFIDPQHRLFLETAWHAVEDAGYSISSLSGKAIGVYAGVSKNDYGELMRESRHEIAPYVSTGTVHSILVNRVSFLLNLHGKSEAVDTACSSSLVALHNAIRDIAAGDCEAALVGGVNALLTPTMFISHSKSGMLSPDGQCKTYSADADGYVRSEGVGVLFIKSLRRAQIDGDHVHAVIKSTAINHGGRSNFLTSPTTEAQAAVVMKALRRGNIDPRSIDYIEAHGTGTPLGDPIEINGLKKAFAQLAHDFPPHPGAQEPHCALGSVKTNVGHLESASGMAGIIKVIMAMRHRQIPSIRNFTRLNPYIELDDSPFFIATETVPWERKELPRRAGVSSFGMGGVNAHVILEEAPDASGDPAAERRACLIPLSAKKGRLKPYAESLLGYLGRYKDEGHAEELDLRDVAYTFQAGRDGFEERIGLVATTIDELIGHLESYVTGAPGSTRNIFVGDAQGDAKPGAELIGAIPAMKAATLAAQWVQGVRVDWSGYHTGRPPRRVPLPTYPFVRRRCWFTDVQPKTTDVAQPAPAVPRVERDDSLNVLKPTDFFIRDHVVRGKPMLPAVGHLELVRSAAASRFGDLQRVRVLKDVYWITPVVVEGKDVTIEIRFTPQKDQLNFEILQNHTVHSKGSLADLPPDIRHLRKLDIAAVQSRCRAGKTKAELYTVLKEYGLAYGSTFQVIDRYVHNEREILAELTLPADLPEGLGSHVLHPSIMDGIFQSVTTLSLLDPRHAGRQFIPFYLEAAEIVSPITKQCFVYATVNGTADDEDKVSSFNATLLDGDGNVLVNIRNLQKRPIVDRPKTEAAHALPADIYYRPVWRRGDLERDSAPATKTLVLFARDKDALQAFREYRGLSSQIVLVQPGAGYQELEENSYQIDPRAPGDYEALVQRLKANHIQPAQVAYLWGLDVQDSDDVRRDLDTTIYGILHFTQAAFSARFHDPIKLVYAHELDRGVTRAIHSMVAGFARTLKYENPLFDYSILGFDQTAIGEIARAVCAELDSTPDVNTLRESIHRGGERYERTVIREDVPSHLEPSELARSVKTGGVYLIAGGGGGLGFVFSQHFASKYKATVLWLGRSALSPAITRKIGEIEKAGGKCEYFSVDITNRAALSQTMSEIKAVHRQIDGVIHAAGVIEDAFILRKRTDSFARVIEPKLLGAIHLDELTRQEKLDFFVVFSSIAALMPNQGQCDYAAANSFMDSFAEARNRLTVEGQRSGVSIALNWPLWARGGMHVTPQEERHLSKVFGMSPLATADGLAIFETALALARHSFPEIHQLVAIVGDKEKIERSLGVEAASSLDGSEGEKAGNGQLEAEIKSIFAARLSVTPETIDVARTLGEIGVSSMTLVGVTQDINRRFDADIKPTLLFDINTVQKLAAYLTETGKSTVAAATPAEPPKWNRSLIDFDQSDPARLTFRRTFRTSEFYLRDHVVDEQYNMPGACYVEMARQAGDLLWGDRSVRKLVHNYWASQLSSPKEDFTAHVQFIAKQDHLAYEIVSFGPGGEKRLHAMGQIAKDDGAARDEIRIDLAAVTSRCDEVQYPKRIYEQILGEGLIVGPTFQPMKQILLNDTEALAMLELPDAIKSTIGDYVLNPALLTGVFQAALLSNRRGTGNTRHYIPIGMDELEIVAPIPAECYVYCRPRPVNARNEEMRKFDLEVCGPDGVMVVRLKGFSIRALKEAPSLAEPKMSAIAQVSGSHAGDAMLVAIQNLIKDNLAGPIGLSAEELDVSVEFDRYGVTSIMIVELNQIFEDMLGPIPKTLFFEYRNIAELAAYFIEHHEQVFVRLLSEPASAAAAPSIEASGDGAVRIEEVHDYLRSLIAKPIGLAAEEIDVDTGFDQYGVNSVMVVELNEIFEEVFGPLSKTLFFEYRSIDELGGYFLESHRDRILSALPPRQVADRAPESVPQSPTESQDHTSDVRLTAAAPTLVPDTHTHDHGDIAIVSAAGKFPGARNLEEFWDVLREGRDCITEIPANRFNYRKYFDADPERNLIYGKWGGFIDDVDQFDPAFFNISPREAELIDPQERLLLEVVWEMLERGGYTRQRLLTLSDRRVGVFVGALWQPYESVGIEATSAGNVVAPSSLLYSIANRISYFFDLAGPSMAIDTACSSSLTALHVACQSIRSGESRFAIVAGVNLSLALSKYLFLSRNRFLSTDGRCRSYGAGGDGYVPGEGVCALLLKPLANAIADADSIVAVIKGSAVNHGGRTNGYTVPNPKAQGNVIAQALEDARVDPQDISYIEGHGTGTSLGDPIEIDGLKKALGLSREGDRFCAIGSVKSNIGHLEAAAGVASIIKVILQMQNGQLAPSLHTEQLNPNIDFGKGLFRVQRELAPWPRPEFLEKGKRREAMRCAGVSSFGAGGANAHVILEEYDGTPAQVSRSRYDTSGPALCVFSARTEDRLIALIARFKEYLRDGVPHNLHEIAHTLQLGREAMRERLAVVAGSIDELQVALDEFLEHERQLGNWYRGRAASGKRRQTDVVAEAGVESADALWKEKDLFRIAEAWVQGVEIDWNHLYGGHSYRFLPLPTYPFARERYWIDTAHRAVAIGVPVSASVTVLHPLLHRNTSVLSEQRYSSTFTGEEFFFVDHQVRMDGRTFEKVLPGVACLEMARAAIEQASPERPDSAVLELHNTVWAQPIVASRNRQISIALSANGDDQIDYRIYSQDAGLEIVHCQGRGVWSDASEPARLDLERLRGEMTPVKVEPSSVYAAFIRTGGVYGPSFQGITGIHQGNRQLMADLRLPRPVEETLGDYVLHPSVMDSALQGYLGLIDSWFEGSSQTRMPFALESLRILSPCTTEMVAWMRYSPDSQAGDRVVKLDIDLCDRQGRVCVRMRGFAVRALKGAAALPEKVRDVAVGLVTVAPVWDAVKVEGGEVRPRAGERVVVIGGEDEQHRALRQECADVEVLPLDGRATLAEIADKLRGAGKIAHVVWILPPPRERSGESERFIEDQEQGVLFGFRLIKALLREGYGLVELGWTVITEDTHRIGGRRDENADAAHSSVQGLVGSMAKEYRNWKVRLVDVAGRAWPWKELLRLGSDERGEGWAYREGQWYRRHLVECEVGESEHGGGYKRGGVYVLIGGAGGVGEVLSEYLIRHYEARVVWIGRREKDQAIEEKQARVTAAGGERPFYIAADARKRDDLERAHQEIKDRYGRINGVIHSAIVLADKSLANMEEEQFRAALSAKVDVAVRLAQVFGREPLDFILYLSSMQSFLKAPGQSNYAAGCTFTDAFAAWQSANAAYPVKVMNWGYWANVGVVAGPEYQERMARLGWGSIEAEEGMAGLERLLSGPLEQMGLIRTKGVEVARALGVTAGEGMWSAREQASPVCERLAGGKSDVAGDATVRELRSWEEQRRDFDRVLARMLSGLMAGMAGNGGQPAQWPREWKATAGVSAEYDRWVTESLQILAAHGHLDETKRFNAGNRDEEQLWADWEREKRRWEQQGNGMTAQVKLVEATLRSLGEILTGRKRATDVMFPSSSLALVEGVYKNNAVADYFNGVMADVVRWYVEERRRQEANGEAGRLKLRLLELGAGTGGSSQGILRKLDAYRRDVEEYRYSDVSRVFLVHGEQAYGEGREYLKYAVVDVEKGLEEQGVERGAYDVVLAANVLHATRRLRDTVRNAKAALKKNGVLVLNELATKSVFMHLTFGLLAGWWAYEDEELRMDGNPGLTAESWKRVLEEEGFRMVCFPAREAHGLGQQIIVAESDGIIRQKHAVAARPRKRLSELVSSPAVPAASSETLLEKAEAWLVEAIGLLLKVKREDVDPDAELSEFGFDSISLTGFANHVNQSYGLELMPTVFFEHATVRSFARHLVEKHGARLAKKLIGPKQAVPTASPRTRAIPAPSLLTAAASATAGLLESVETWLVDAVGLLLKVKRADVDPDAELSEFGFDSISLTGFANHVNQTHGLELMPTIFFEHPTVRTFARYLVEKHGERLLASFGAEPKRSGSAPTIPAATQDQEAPALLEKVEEWLVEAVGVLLKVKRADVDLDAELSEFGFDSISLTGFANHVNQTYRLELMPTIFFEHPTVRAFARYLVAKHSERLMPKFGIAAAGSASQRRNRTVQPAPNVAPVPAMLAEATGNGAEPIAIIGMSGRFPGAEDLDQFWENLKAGKESIVEIPPERWDWRALYGDEKEDGNKSSVKWGAFMEGVDEFDPLFFGISPREAELMDPQHRLTMMYGWKAFEDAGYGPKQLWGSRTGIFIGTTSSGYGELLLTQSGAAIEGYSATGLVSSVGPNRLSFLLNLHGPSEPIETACSSSLVAVHRAVGAIAAGDCEMALVGGVNTLFPTLHISFSKAGMLSPDGRCKTFSSRADGFVRGEGVGMVVLKRLSAAERDGDHIYGLIRGSAENHGGRAQSLTAPNPQAQAELIKDAYRRAGVSPGSISYIEAHGTGTALGDPIEINGLKSAFQSLYEELGEEAATGTCGLGSVKSNIGHLELAAGMAGLIKILLQLKHRTLVSSLHCEDVNPYIRLEESPFYIVKENRPWTPPADGQGQDLPRLAGVSSFGFGGVNAHVVVEEYLGAGASGSARAGSEPGPVMVVLSAKDAERLKEHATQLRQAIGRGAWSDRDLASLAYTLQVGREAMDHRLAMTVGSLAELEAKLGEFVGGKNGIEGLHRGELKRNNETLAVFRGDEELREAVGKWIQRGKWSKVLELWVKGLDVDWEQLYGDEKPRRLSLPTYPFARERCWIDTTASAPATVQGAPTAVLHPLLHRNTSDLSEQRYSSTFTGDEFFLRDHQIRTDGGAAQKILPGVAYLEMARAAIQQASPMQPASSVVELHDIVWLKPVVVAGARDVSIALSADDSGGVDYEIYSIDAGQRITHCQGQAVFHAPFAPARLEIENVRRQMQKGRLDASAIYTAFTRMGLDYGPTHRGITAIDLGEKQLLAELRLPAMAAMGRPDFVLHPSLMDSALQASLGLIVDLNHVPGKPSVPFAIDSLHILSACTNEMFAWVRSSADSRPEDRTIRVDIDVCDSQGNVCVQLRGLTSRVLEGAAEHLIHAKSDSVMVDAAFDDAFYQSLIADIVNQKVSVDEAVELA